MKIKAKTNAIVRARIVKGMTQRDLAQLSGLSYAYISLLERSVKAVGPGTAKKLSDLLEQPLEELFTIE
ncbi:MULTISPECIES: helix-turn-helix domain-containing protein [Paenibacillus]|uniref:Rha family transcriptional regulator n=4 Tax=Paenibacillus TaxID=44249 RepID=A0A165RBT8_9BACL|nr:MULTISPECIES: helix-turn-helix transcriptional regulator [Paenibacillus]KPV55549.1 Rha family transcriptional regulator [Paenibacillus sp. A3]KZE80512.1 Rha family transcriptional regulator [Paenibacillus elgii]MBU7321043.1 helix-turn-helix domain-containing protein [Paenibacillus oleatilyticus]MCP1309499.1 helix-turn-helix domain-containing protein [Paenibacillus tyrfis]MCP3775096.1 helix-turn-helix domain-containing protein [Paenibacillus sp. MZ04-78.2]